MKFEKGKRYRIYFNHSHDDGIVMNECDEFVTIVTDGKFWKITTLNIVKDHIESWREF